MDEALKEIADIVAQLRSPIPIKNWRGDTTGEIPPTRKMLDVADRIEDLAKRLKDIR